MVRSDVASSVDGVNGQRSSHIGSATNEPPELKTSLAIEIQ
jgi:hypothetical protein